MRRISLLACCLLMFSGCALMPTNKPLPPSPAPIKRVVVNERIDCPTPDAPSVPPARATNAADATAEEQALTSVTAQLAQRIESLWACIARHNEKAGK